MALDLTSVTNALASYMPSGNALIQNLALGAATSVVVAGMKSDAGKAAIDPLGLFPHPANNPAAVSGASITASAFAALPAAVQAQLTAAGVHIVAG